MKNNLNILYWPFFTLDLSPVSTGLEVPRNARYRLCNEFSSYFSCLHQQHFYGIILARQNDILIVLGGQN